MKAVRQASLAIFVSVSLGLFGAGLSGAIPEENASPVAVGGLASVLASGISYSMLSAGHRRTLLGILAAIPGAVAVASGLRFMMRSVAILSGLAPSFSFGGTFLIFAASLVPCVLLGVGYLYFRKILPGVGLVKGFIYGVAIGGLLGLPLLWLAASELSLARDLTIPVAAFMGLPIIFGLSLEVSYRLLRI